MHDGSTCKSIKHFVCWKFNDSKPQVVHLNPDVASEPEYNNEIPLHLDLTKLLPLLNMNMILYQW